MKVLNSKIDLSSFYRGLKEARRKALFLDYDGTLAPFHMDPGKAFPYPGVCEKINEILRAGDISLVIITGRQIEDLLPLLELEKQPEIWGSHGLERLKADGSYEIASMDERQINGLVVADEWIEAYGFVGRCEKKPGCLALHWRGLDGQRIDEIRNQIEPKWGLIAEGWDLDLAEFDGGLELYVPARRRTDAVKAVLDEMSRDTVAAYLGNDLIGEDVFRYMRGRGLGVMVRKELRPTAADLWIKPPDELLDFLSHWLPHEGKNAFSYKNPSP